MSNHKEIDCPTCEGPVCDLDGDSPSQPQPEPVFVLVYEHKHGVDFSVHRSREGAVEAAYGLAAARIEEDRWEECNTDKARAEFEAFEDLEAAVDFFNIQELEWNYSESLEIRESVITD